MSKSIFNIFGAFLAGILFASLPASAEIVDPSGNILPDSADIGDIDQSKTKISDLKTRIAPGYASVSNAAMNAATAAQVAGKQDKLPYPTNQVPWAVIADKPVIPTVPTKVSEFENDAGYVTETDVSSTYATKEENAAKQDKLPYPTNAIPQGAVSGLSTALDGKVEKSDFNTATNNINASIQTIADTNATLSAAISGLETKVDGKQDALSERQIADIDAVQTKASVEDLYGVMESDSTNYVVEVVSNVTAWRVTVIDIDEPETLSFPDDCFPITYSDITLGSPVVISNNTEIVYSRSGGSIYTSWTGGGYVSGFAFFSSSTLAYDGRDIPIVDLLFNGVEPVEGMFPLLLAFPATYVTNVVGYLDYSAFVDTNGVSTIIGTPEQFDISTTNRVVMTTVPAQIGMATNDIAKAIAGKVSTNDFNTATNDILSLVIPLQFAQYYPEGNVKSAAEFTPGIKYDDPDTTNRTITVKPFCNTGTAENDNSGLVGRVVIPPFVDASGNGYISDDGTRFKVVGVSGFAGRIFANTNPTAVLAPNTVTTISGSALAYCTALSSVALPAAAAIGDFVFASSAVLASVDFGNMPRSSVPTLGNSVFAGVPSSCKIIVPYTQYDVWIAADGWKDLPQEFVRHAEKADKPATFTEGNLAALDSQGNPTDSGVAKGDYALASALAAAAAAATNHTDTAFAAAATASTNYTDVAVLLAATASTNYTDSATNATTQALMSEIGSTISATNPTFSNAVLSVGLNIDTNAVAAINALVEQGQELPIGSATTVGALLLALAAAVVALKRIKANSTSIAPGFSEEATYVVGDHVTYLGVLYECVVAKTTASATTPDQDIYDSTHTTNHWKVTDMTTPDATVDITADRKLRIVGADGTLLWQQGYDLKGSSSNTPSDGAETPYEFAANATDAVTLTLPSVASGKVGDFLIDVTNPALDSTATGYPSAFSDSATYAVGDKVAYDSKIWRCTTAVSTAGAWTGSTNWEEAWPYLTIAGLDSTLSVAVPAGENLTDILSFEPGTMCELLFTLSAFRINSRPTWVVARKDVENGGASV